MQEHWLESKEENVKQPMVQSVLVGEKYIWVESSLHEARGSFKARQGILLLGKGGRQK